MQAADGLLFDAQMNFPERQGTPQIGRRNKLDKTKSASALDSSRGGDSSNDTLNSSRTKDKKSARLKKSQQSSATTKEQGAGQAKKRIGLLMKESHSIFKLDEKQKALMHQMK